MDNTAASDSDDDDGKDAAPEDTSAELAAEPTPEEKQEIEAERERRLDPANRPENAEVDNSEREFDARMGEFKDDPQGVGPFNDPNSEDGVPEA